MSIRPSVRSQSNSMEPMNYSDMNRAQWDKSNDMTFRVIQGQGQGHRAFQFTKIAIFKVYLLRHFCNQVEFDYCIRYYGTMSKFCRVRFLNFCPVHVPRAPKVCILCYVRPSLRSQSNSMKPYELYSVMDRGRSDKSNDTRFKGFQGQGHRAFKLMKIAIFIVYLFRHFCSQVEFDYCIRYYGTISKFCRVRFLNFCPVHVPRATKFVFSAVFEATYVRYVYQTPAKMTPIPGVIFISFWGGRDYS